MRLSSSVRLTWSAGPGSATGGAGGRPPGFFARGRFLGCARRHLGLVIGLLASVAFLRPCLDRRPRPGDLGQPLLAPRQFVRDRHPIRNVGLVGSLRLGHQLRHLGLQLRLDLARMLVRQCAVATRIGVDLGAVKRDRPQLQHAHLARELQNLYEQQLDLFEETPPKNGDGVVVRMLIGGDEAKRQRVIGRPLQLAAGKNAGGLTIDQDAEQDGRVIRRLARASVSNEHLSQVETGNHVHHEPRQMRLRQPLVHRRRHQETGIAINRTEVLHAGMSESERESIGCPQSLSQAESWR